MSDARTLPKVVRRGRIEHQEGYGCDECDSREVPAIVMFIVPTLTRPVAHSVCRRCLENAVAMFNDPNLVETKTPLRLGEGLARQYATKNHGFQKYDSGTEPYVVHLAEVRDALVEFGWERDIDLLVAAWLHDVVEDTTVIAANITAEFGARVSNLVWAMTGQGSSRAERNENAYRKMVSYPESIPVKLADRIANARASKETSPDALFEMYRREHPTFKAVLEPAGGNDPRTTLMWKTLDEIFA